MKEEFHWVLIDRQQLGISTDTPRMFGSISELARAGIEDRGQILSEENLRTRLRHNQVGERYFKNERFVIKETKLERSKRKK